MMEGQKMNDTFGERLRMVRKKRGLTEDELAERTGMTRTSISYYETGKQWPSLFNAVCIADVLGVSLDWLAGRK
jgi:transcriptional regulator with XRE-family HTH domain